MTPQNPRHYDTLSEAIEGLKKRGYIYNFKLTRHGLECAEPKLQLRPEDFDVDEFHRFEGESNPADSSVVYAVSSRDGIKGMITDAYGAYAEGLSFEMLDKLRIH